MKGDPNAQLILSGFYLAGSKGAKKSIPLAIHWALKAAESGSSEAGYRLGVLYMQDGVSFDKSKHLYWMNWSAERGYAPAQISLGLSYSSIQGKLADLKLSAKWYRKAAEQGSAEGMFEYGFRLKHGQGVDLDSKASLAWYEKAALTGMPIALHECGVGYFHGIGAPVNDVKASAYFRLATDSSISYGYNYHEDINDAEAVKFLKILDSRMSPADRLAAIALAKQLRQKIDPILEEQFPERRESRLHEEKNRKEFERLLALAEKGDAQAQFNLYPIYWNGQISDIQDTKKALYWLNKSADQGYYLAQVSLAAFYETGDGVAAPDLHKAFFWNLKAAEQGNVQGMYNVGRLYELGRGVEKNEMEAFAYYLLALNESEPANDYEDAREKVASFDGRLSPEARRLGLERAAMLKADLKAKGSAKMAKPVLK